VQFIHRLGSGALLEKAKRGLVRELLVYRFDRLGRDNIDTLLTLAALTKLGVQVTSVKEGSIENNAQGRLKAGIHSLFAEYERASTVERSRDGTQALVKAGKWLGGIAPFGYRKIGEKKTGTLVLADQPIPGRGRWSEVKTVQEIYRLASEGKSCQEIADYLNDHGIPADCWEVLQGQRPKGKRKKTLAGKWSMGRVRNILVNKTYMGVHAWGKRRMIRDENGKRHLLTNPREQWQERRSFPAIVDDELWQKANRALQANLSKSMAHRGREYLLRGLIPCPVCKLTYTGSTVRRPNKKDAYYRCPAAHSLRGEYGKRGERCPSKGISAEIEAVVWNDVRDSLFQPGGIIQKLEEARKKAEQVAPKKERLAARIRELEENLVRVKDEEYRNVTSFNKGLFEEEYFVRDKQRLATERDALAADLEALRHTAEERRVRVQEIQAVRPLLQQLRDKLAAKPGFETQRQSVDTLR
jgi:site-specific DNA recombinase